MRDRGRSGEMPEFPSLRAGNRTQNRAEWKTRGTALDMHDLRKLLGWLFAISSLGCLRIAFLRVLRTISGHNGAPPFRNVPIAAAFFVVATIFALAWWSVWKAKPSSRAWGIAASLIYILLPVGSVMYLSRSIWSAFGVMLATGIAGLIAFLPRYEQHGSSKNTSEAADSA